MALDDLIEVHTPPKNEPWEDAWKGMPEYKQEAKKPYREMTIKFRNEDDFIEFCKMIDQKFSEKTKWAWYPKLEINRLIDLRWVDDEDTGSGEV